MSLTPALKAWHYLRPQWLKPRHPGGDLGDLTQVNCADCHGTQTPEK